MINFGIKFLENNFRWAYTAEQVLHGTPSGGKLIFKEEEKTFDSHLCRDWQQRGDPWRGGGIQSRSDAASPGAPSFTFFFLVCLFCFFNDYWLSGPCGLASSVDKHWGGKEYKSSCPRVRLICDANHYSSSHSILTFSTGTFVFPIEWDSFAVYKCRLTIFNSTHFFKKLHFHCHSLLSLSLSSQSERALLSLSSLSLFPWIYKRAILSLLSQGARAAHKPARNSAASAGGNAPGQSRQASHRLNKNENKYWDQNAV